MSRCLFIPDAIADHSKYDEAAAGAALQSVCNPQGQHQRSREQGGRGAKQEGDSQGSCSISSG